MNLIIRYQAAKVFFKSAVLNETHNKAHTSKTIHVVLFWFTSISVRFMGKVSGDKAWY